MNNKLKDEKKITAISLFSGAGGDTLGLKQSGINVIAFSEFNKSAILTHVTNFPDSNLIGKKYNGDIVKIPNDYFHKYRNKIDIIFAGFPCQGFSHAGKKDKFDKRNNLFMEFVRVVNIIKPKFIIGENVKGLLERKKLKTSYGSLINNEFKKIGYKMCNPLLLSLNNYGIPQKRKRVFFIGSLSSKPNIKLNIQKDVPINSIIQDTLENSIEINIDNFPYLKKAYEESKLTFINSKRRKIKGTPHPFLLRKIKSGEISFGVRKSPHHVEVLNLNKPSKTINCSYSFQPRQFILLKNKSNKFFIRELNIDELQQIQGFPSNFIFRGNKNDIIKQIGNAVPPLIVKKISKYLIENN